MSLFRFPRALRASASVPPPASDVAGRLTRRQSLSLACAAAGAASLAWYGGGLREACAADGRPGARLANSSLLQGQAAPELAGISSWLNSPPLSLTQLRGRVVLLEFWTLGCINCVHTLPQVTAWDAAYRAHGLSVIGVHTPEFPRERELAEIQAAVQRHGIRYPVAVDNDYRTWQAYANRYWPATYLIDRVGRLAHLHVGEGDYEQTRQVFERLLAEPA